MRRSTTSASNSTMSCNAGSGRSLAWKRGHCNAFVPWEKKVHEASWSREAFHDFHPHDLEHDGEASPRHPEVSCLCFDACACVVCFVARPTTPSSLPRRLQSEMGRAQPVAPCILCVVCRVRGRRALCRPPHGETRPIQSHPRGPCLQS